MGQHRGAKKPSGKRERARRKHGCRRQRELAERLGRSDVSAADPWTKGKRGLARKKPAIEPGLPLRPLRQAIPHMDSRDWYAETGISSSELRGLVLDALQFLSPIIYNSIGGEELVRQLKGPRRFAVLHDTEGTICVVVVPDESGDPKYARVYTESYYRHYVDLRSRRTSFWGSCAAEWLILLAGAAVIVWMFYENLIKYLLP